MTWSATPPLAAQPGERDRNPIPISALQHAVYCLRQAALIHLERMWSENRFTAEGHVLHISSSTHKERRARGVRQVTALALSSQRLRLTGVADLVEFHTTDNGEVPYPVEYKRGKAKLHRADEVQLCAQGLCLEEMMDTPVPEGALYYAETKRRVVVPFDRDLRAMTENVVAQLSTIFTSLETPPAIYKASLCRACSLLELCRPKQSGKAVRSWRERMLDTILDDENVAT